MMSHNYIGVEIANDVNIDVPFFCNQHVSPKRNILNHRESVMKSGMASVG